MEYSLLGKNTYLFFVEEHIFSSSSNEDDRRIDLSMKNEEDL
jgi:hypothetical protein